MTRGSCRLTDQHLLALSESTWMRGSNGGKFAGGGFFSKRCNAWLQDHLGSAAVLTTTSGTHALEMAALLCDLKPGDEVLLPSYAFSSTATAFARCGASLVFVDVEPLTMNINPKAAEAAITERTRVLVVLHYVGIACDMTALLHGNMS